MPNEALSWLLDSRALTGRVAVHRWFGPPRHLIGVPIDAPLTRVVEDRCGVWGGGAHLLVPTAESVAAPHSVWRRVLDLGEYDRAEGVTGARDSGGFEFPAPTVLAVAALDSDRDRLTTVDSPIIEADDPWLVAYLSVLGSLPLGPSQSQVQRFGLREDLLYDEVIRVERPSVVGSASDLATRLRRFDRASPRDISLAALTTPGISTTLAGRAVFPRDAALSERVGANVLVVYTPGSVDDFCLLWNLQAAAGRTLGLPLGIPASDDIVAVISEWERAGIVRWGANFAIEGTLCLTSTSVGRDELNDIASELGSVWIVAPPEEALPLSGPPGRGSSEIALFERGRSTIERWHDEDRRTFQNVHHSRELGVGVRLRPQARRLPPYRSLEVMTFTNGRYAGGSYCVDGQQRDSLTELRWPTGWTVLQAYARDRGLEVRRSAAGQAAEALVHVMGGLEQVALLASPAVLRLLYRLGERAGMTWFRGRVGAILKDSGRGDADALDAVDAILREVAASPDDAEARSLVANEFRALGTPAQVASWIQWAEDHGVLLRGLVLECDQCSAKGWRTPAELAPPVMCRACGRAMDRPYRHDQMPPFRYRASDGLLQVLSHDALGHLLTLHWMTGLFHVGFDHPEDLYGGHPGVEFLQGGRVIGEADIILLFSDGSAALGEYKRAGHGLHSREIAKLEKLTDALAADWTFLATHDSYETLPPLWRASERRLPDRPRFVLAGEHLYSYPVRALGDDPFAWPDATKERHTMSPASHASWLEEVASPDSELLQAWKHLDDTGAD